jgi:DNA-binding MarR family transcriptional regulator
MPEPRWLTPAEQRVWRDYLRMNGMLMAELNRQSQAEFGLSGPDYAVLVELTDRPDARVRVSELGRALQWEKSRLSHHLVRMQQRGFVSRADCPEDARGSFVVLTQKGRDAIEQAAPRHVAAVRTLFLDNLTPEQITTLGAIADQVLPHLQCPGTDSC